MQELPEQAGIQLANWYWKGVRQFVWERFGTSLSRSSCLNWLHRLGFAFKRPKKRLLKADQAKRESFVVEYGALWDEAERTGGKIFFADEAHFRADAELRGKWVLKGEPAPRFHEGRLCRATARTSTGMRRSGAGRGRRPPAICAWEAGPRCRRGSAASSPVWPAGAARSNGAAGRCCNRGPKRSCQIPSPIPGVRQMHIPPWPWFSACPRILLSSLRRVPPAMSPSP